MLANFTSLCSRLPVSDILTAKLNDHEAREDDFGADCRGKSKVRRTSERSRTQNSRKDGVSFGLTDVRDIKREDRAIKVGRGEINGGR